MVALIARAKELEEPLSTPVGVVGLDLRALDPSLTLIRI